MTAWMPQGIGPNQNEIWHVVHADDDEDDIDRAEMEEGIRALEISTVEGGPAPPEMEGACSEEGPELAEMEGAPSQAPASENLSRAEQANMAQAMRESLIQPQQPTEDHEELRIAICQSLNEAQRLAQAHTERYRALGDELLARGAYAIDMLCDGSCQFNAVRWGLNKMLQKQETTQSMRDKVVEHMRNHNFFLKECRKSPSVGKKSNSRMWSHQRTPSSISAHTANSC